MKKKKKNLKFFIALYTSESKSEDGEQKSLFKIQTLLLNHGFLRP